MKNKFEEKATVITENDTNDDMPAAMVSDDDDHPGGMVCEMGVTGPGNYGVPLFPLFTQSVCP